MSWKSKYGNEKHWTYFLHVLSVEWGERVSEEDRFLLISGPHVQENNIPQLWLNTTSSTTCKHDYITIVVTSSIVLRIISAAGSWEFSRKLLPICISTNYKYKNNRLTRWERLVCTENVKNHFSKNSCKSKDGSDAQSAVHHLMELPKAAILVLPSSLVVLL